MNTGSNHSVNSLIVSEKDAIDSALISERHGNDNSKHAVNYPISPLGLVISGVLLMYTPTCLRGFDDIPTRFFFHYVFALVFSICLVSIIYSNIYRIRQLEQFIAETANFILRYIIVIFVSLLMTMQSYYNGMNMFCGFDCSLGVDYAWRMYLGQKPFADFYTIMPPIYLLSNYWAYCLFGVSWSSIALGNSLALLVFYHWLYLLFRKILGQVLLSLILTTMILGSTLYYHGFLQYNIFTTVFYILALLSSVALVYHPGSNAVRLSLFLSILFCIWCKPLIAAPLAIVWVLSFFNCKERVVDFIVIPIVSMISSFVLMYASGIDPRLLIKYYFDAPSSGKLNILKYYLWSKDNIPVEFIHINFISLVYMLLLGAICLWQRKKIFSNTYLFAIVMIVFPTSVYMTVINGEMPVVTYVPMIVTLSLFAFQVKPTLTKLDDSLPEIKYNNSYHINSLVSILVCFVLVHTLVFGYKRYRVAAAAPYYSRVGMKAEDGYFAHANLAESQMHIMHVVNEFIRQTGNNKIYFGMRLEYLYAVTGIPSPVNFPVWWDEGISYPVKDAPYILERFRKLQMDYIILGTNDTSFMHKDVMNDIMQYQNTQTHGPWKPIYIDELVSIYRRNTN